MTEIGQIIKSVLENNDSKCLDNASEREHVAAECEQVLVKATLQQLADLLGGSLEIDNDGQAVIYTNVYCEPFSQHRREY